MTFKSLFLGFYLLGVSVSGWADFYQVENVSAQASGESAKQAKTQAIEQAQVQAFSRLMKRLIGRDNVFTDNLPTTQEIVAMVQDMSIQKEKNTKTEYWATVQVGFNEKAVQTFLKNKNIEFLQQEPSKLLVIPVFQKGEQVFGTLDEENPVFQFLRHRENLSDFYSFVLPNGDLDEIVLANKSLANAQLSDLETLVQRYGAEGFLLLKAQDVGLEHWRLKADVYVDNRLLQTQEAFDWYQGYSLDEAWNVLMNQMEDDWRSKQKAPEEAVYFARLTEPTLQDWVNDKQTLEKLPFLKDVMVRGVSHNQMLISYTYEGEPEKLSDKWQQAGWEWQSDFIGPSGSLKRKDVFYE